MNKEYICVAPSKEVFNVYGESLGMQGERALYYSKDIGKHRIYRQSYPIEPEYFKGKNINRNMELLTFKDRYKAQELCDEINEIYNDNFKAIEKSDSNEK